MDFIAAMLRTICYCSCYCFSTLHSLRRSSAHMPTISNFEHRTSNKHHSGSELVPPRTNRCGHHSRLEQDIKHAKWDMFEKCVRSCSKRGIGKKLCRRGKILCTYLSVCVREKGSVWKTLVILRAC